MKIVRTPKFLYVENLPRLRKKLKDAEGPLRHIWLNIQNFVQAARNERHFPPFYYPAFHYLITEDEASARLAAEQIKETLAIYLAGDYSIDVHFHTWCNSAPMARLAVAFDWIADSPSLSAEEAREIQEAILDYTFKHPFNRLKGRMRRADNQVAAMSFCCALVGYLFGVKRGRDLRAQRMMADGMMRFPDLIGLSPPGGYSYEGSTYYGLIVSPLTAWYSALMEQITGEDHFFKTFPPNHTSAREILETFFKLVGPSGLLPPWDNSGWMLCNGKMALTYLARETGDPLPLKMIETLGLFAQPSEIAWGGDDNIWTLIWWPDKVARGADSGGESVFSSWALEKIGGALVNQKKEWRLFQAWDQCSYGVNIGRCQVNPNMISLEAWGSPIFTDGTPDFHKCSFFDFEVETFRDVLKEGELDSIRNYFLTQGWWNPRTWVKSFSQGLIGASNSIVINGERHYSPLEPKEGRLVAFGATSQLQMVASDAASFYQPRYPVQTMVRASLLVRDDYFLVVDHVEADSPLRCDWQVFARGQLALEDHGVNIKTPEKVEVDLIPLDAALQPTLLSVPGFPRDFEGSSTLIQYTLSGTSLTFPFLICPCRALTPVDDLTQGWSVVAGDREEGIIAGRPLGFRSEKVFPISECGLAGARHGRDGWVWASRTFTLPPGAGGRRALLRFPFILPQAQIWINGHKPEYAAYGLSPLLLDITPFVSQENTVVVAGETSQGELAAGAVELLVETEKPPRPKGTALGQGHYRIEGSFGTDELWVCPDGRPSQEGDISLRARALLLAENGHFAALQATRFNVGHEIQFFSERPVDVSYSGGVLSLGDLSGPVEIELTHPDFFLRLSSRGVLDIQLSGRKRPELVARLSARKPILCNGRVLAVTPEGPGSRLVIPSRFSRKFLVPGNGNSGAQASKMARLVSLASHEAPPARKELIEALGEEDWRIQQFAAEQLGRMNCREAIVPLIQLLADESAEKIYDEFKLMGWSEAREKLRTEGHEFFRKGPGGVGKGVKRYRLKAALIEALGRLRAREAVPVLCEILKDQREFYPVHSAACRALGVIGDPSALPVLRQSSEYPEVNTRYRALDAVHLIEHRAPRHPEYPDRGYE